MSAPRTHTRTTALLERARAQGAVVAAIVYPCSIAALDGALEARNEGLFDPILIGPRRDIARIAREHAFDLADFQLIEAATGLDAAKCAAALVHADAVKVVVKGSLHSDELIKGIAMRRTGLLTARRISHVFIMDIPRHDRLLMIADAAINVAPNLRVKRDIVQNTVDLARVLGIAMPHVAILSAIEDINAAVPSTLEAAALRDMATRGEITGGIVDGPLAFDNAISAEAARMKGIASPVSGQTDIMIVPGIEAGNILYKSLVYLSDAVAAGIVMGTKAPVVLTSRADSAQSRVASAAVAALLVHAKTGAA